MKKDKNQFIAEATGESTSSTALTLQQFRKEAEKKEVAAESAKVRCRICFKEIAPTPRCFGHAGGGGGAGGRSGSDNTSDDKVSKSDDTSLLKAEELVDDTEELIGSMQASEELDSGSDRKSIDTEVIADLVAKGLLVINNDRESMTLTIKLQCAPKSLSEEQRKELKKFMEAIIKEFNSFKEQHHLSNDCINMIQDEEGNILSLHISLPTLALYDAFIRQLANNLLPTPNPKLQTKDEHQETKVFAPTPLSMEPQPSDNKSKPPIPDEVNKHEDIATNKIETLSPDQESFNPSPFSTQMKPWKNVSALA